MPLLILGLVFFTLLWMVWTLLWLFWPVTLLVGGAVLCAAHASLGALNAQRRHAAARAPSTHRAATARSMNIATRRLRELEEERSKFGEFLERLRKWKDTAEFDRFIADRR